MNSNNRIAYLALAFVCIVWGTTYLALLIGVRHFPPFLFTGLRQFTAGLLLAGFMLLVRQQKLGGWSNIWRQALTGFMMITLGNGLVGWAEMYVPSGIAALIASLSPLWIILINTAINRQEKTHPFAWSGVLVGV
ncbi:MAG: EamA family transporter, partial [Saprospiraceae bacterium]